MDNGVINLYQSPTNDDNDDDDDPKNITTQFEETSRKFALMTNAEKTKTMVI